MTFQEAAQLATAKGCTLERGGKRRPYGMKTGYILWYRGMWSQYSTLRQVCRELHTLPTIEQKAV